MFIYCCQLKWSVDEAAEKGNIAVLANAVIGKTGIKATVQLYIKLAFLVSQILHCGDDATDILHAGVAHLDLCKSRW